MIRGASEFDPSLSEGCPKARSRSEIPVAHVMLQLEVTVTRTMTRTSSFGLSQGRQNLGALPCRLLGSPKDSRTLALSLVHNPRLNHFWCSGPVFISKDSLADRFAISSRRSQAFKFVISFHHLDPSPLGYPRDFPPRRSRSLTSIVVFGSIHHPIFGYPDDAFTVPCPQSGLGASIRPASQSCVSQSTHV
jgi:hypothetical protein